MPPDPVTQRTLKEQDREWVQSLVEHAQASSFFGRIILSFQNGAITHVENNRTFKPPHREREVPPCKPV